MKYVVGVSGRRLCITVYVFLTILDIALNSNINDFMCFQGNRSLLH